MQLVWAGGRKRDSAPSLVLDPRNNDLFISIRMLVRKVLLRICQRLAQTLALSPRQLLEVRLTALYPIHRLQRTTMRKDSRIILRLIIRHLRRLSVYPAWW